MKRLLQWLLGISVFVALSIVIWNYLLPSNEFKTEEVRSFIQSMGPEKFRAEALQMTEFKSQDNKVESNKWPQLVLKLKPAYVEIHSEGIFICIQDLGADQSGVFVPFTESFIDKDEGEPFFEKQFEGIWFYFSPG